MGKSKPKIVVIGGGTGIHPVLRGLKNQTDICDVTAIVAMTDSGGSTGKLRDEFGRLPVGDVRMALVALAEDDEEYDRLLRELFLYRFDKGEGLVGHNFGNLLLVALAEVLGSEMEAIKFAAKILRIKGRVLPVTKDHLNIVATYEDGIVLDCEHYIDAPPKERYGKRIIDLKTSPAGSITGEAKESIMEADMVLLGPGDLYSSLLANCVVGGVSEALTATKARFVFAANLMTKPGQTDNMKVSDHVREVGKYVGREPDIVLVNTSKIPDYLDEKYATSEQFPVVDDSDLLLMKVVREDLLSTEPVVHKSGDIIRRSLVRGDAKKTAAAILKLLE